LVLIIFINNAIKALGIVLLGILLGLPPLDMLGRILMGEAVDPSEYCFRTTPVFETASEKYGWLKQVVAVGIGQFLPTGVAYRVYAILQAG
jgi:hypothetical protein